MLSTDHIVSEHRGFLVRITTKRWRGFLMAPEGKDISLGDDGDGWIFPSRAAVKRALDIGFGLNLRACRFEVLPATQLRSAA